MCSPQKVDVAVRLDAGAEEVRTLPVLGSGAWSIAGVEIPDSHGFLDVKMVIPHANLTYVRVHGLHLDLMVASKNLPVHVVELEGGRLRQDGANESWSGTVSDKETLRFWWTIDRGRIPTPRDMVLAEGASYSIRVMFEWDYQDCSFTAKGSVDQVFDGFVRATLNTQSFRPDGAARIDASGSSVGFRANYTVKSGLTVNLQSSAAVLLFFSEAKETGVAIIPNVAWTINGLPGSSVNPSSKLQTFSGDATKYSRNGVLQPLPTSTAGVYVLVQTLSYRSSDGTLGLTTDLFGHARLA